MASIKSLLILATVLAVVVLLTPSLGDQTAEFRERFMKKCTSAGQEKGTCEEILQTFQKAYVGKDKCEVTDKDYDELLKKASYPGPCGKTVFYSGTYKMAHEFTKDRDLFTLEETLLGYVMNELSWHGEVDNEKTFTDEYKCPEPKLGAVRSFWKAASIRFAEFACEEVIVMLDGTRDKPYHDKTFFARFELPNLKPSKVKQLTVVLLESPEPCSCDSLGALRTDLHKDIGCTCHSVPQERLQECINKKTSTAECW